MPPAGAQGNRLLTCLPLLWLVFPRSHSLLGSASRNQSLATPTLNDIHV
jgi:hypothetical protein